MNESWDEKQLIKEGEIAEIVGISHFHHIIKIQADQEIQTHKGYLLPMISGRPWEVLFIVITGISSMSFNLP